MITFFICNENEIMRKNAEEIINKVMMKNDYNYKIHLYSDYDKNFMNDLNNSFSNKIYILDLDLPSNSGINVAHKIRDKDVNSIIIFFTSHYELGPILLEEEIMFLTFISKFNNYKQRLESAIRTSLRIIDKNPKIKFEDRGVLVAIPNHEILYVTRDCVHRKSIIKTEYGEFKTNKTLLELSKLLGDDFIKTHRSCFINKNKYRVIDKKNHIIMFNNGETINLLSDNYKKEIV